ncbi:hypothetical protein C2G38_2037038 [Gigaspora rosea]|uniref:Uncharacterized protein n=1 Tax=Gigaspora rosea TaxID=44941 RepID=A0A397V754_9GLOM|nr:hypothetical protein C2G38_2037038 [Gigaspora rosea]
MYKGENIIFNHEPGNIGISQNKEILPIQRPSTVSVTAPTTRKALQKRNHYGKIWGLAREVILLVVNSDDNEIIKILQGYITRKKNERDEYNDETQNKRKEKRPLYPIHTQAVSNLQEASESAGDSAIDENQVLLEEDNEDNDSEVLDNETISIQAPQGVQNPPRIIGRGRPSKRRFMSSIEKEQNQRGTSSKNWRGISSRGLKTRRGTSSRGSYKCGQCGDVGHNAAYHKQKGRGRGSN